MADSRVWNVSEGAELFLAKVKPKDGCQMEEESDKSEGEKRPKGKERKEPERDVYSFPGDSDPESPPPAPWAHCTFIQRCRKKRVLLRPFSGLGTTKRYLPDSGKRARVSPQKSKPAEPAQLSGGLYEFEEVSFGEGTVGEPIKLRNKEEEEEEVEEEVEGESEAVPGLEIFTCVECSIYFKKQVHLQEHIVEHCQGGAGKAGGRFCCGECGWHLPNRPALADHHRRHQESRMKILEEIEKLNETGKLRESQKPEAKLSKQLVSPDPAVMQDASSASVSGKESDPKIVASQPLSPAPVSTADADPAAVGSEPAPLNPARAPVQARGVSYRRRFVCAKCNFSTRTAQALANHTKTHNRKKQADPPAKGPLKSCPAAPLACGLCAFLTPSQALMREHHRLLHPGQLSTPQADDTAQCSTSNAAARGSNPRSGPGGRAASEDGPAARPSRQVGLRCAADRRLGRRGRTWTGPAKAQPRLDDDKLPRSEGEEEEEEQGEDRSAELDEEHSQPEASSPAGVKPQTRARANSGKRLLRVKTHTEAVLSMCSETI